jgi:hypothetical protein
VRGGEAVGRTRIDLEGGARDDLGREHSCVGNGYKLVVLPVDDQGGDVEPLQVFGEIGLGEGLDAIEGAFEPDLHRPQPEHVTNALRYSGTRPVGAVEGGTDLLVELRAIRKDRRALAVKRLDGCAAWIGLGLEQERRNRVHQHSLSDARGAMTADVAGHLAAAGGMANQDHIVQIERFTAGILLQKVLQCRTMRLQYRLSKQAH